MSTATPTSTERQVAPDLPDDEHYARNLIDGRWQFPAAPYDFEIRNPGDSTVTTVVPLSSRFDVDPAVAAAQRAATSPEWTDPGRRSQALGRVVHRLEAHRYALVQVQCTETGLAEADSRAAVEATLALARAILRRSAARPGPTGDSRVSGHVLSWGLPLTEVVTSTLPALLRGDGVVIKPSLRGPLSAVAFSLVADAAGLPAGVLNVVQGTGVDVGAELLGRADLRAVHAHGNRRTLDQARRATSRTGAVLHELRAGGNLVVVGPGRLADAELEALCTQLVTGARLHAGAFGLPLLALHRDADPRIVTRLRDVFPRTTAGPLPTDALRARVLARIRTLVETGGEILAGGTVPDDIAHRMGWRFPPTLLDLGACGSAAAQAEQRLDPVGPVLSVLAWTEPAELAAHVDSARRYGDGCTVAWGGRAIVGDLRCGLVIDGSPRRSWPDAEAVAPSWTAGAR